MGSRHSTLFKESTIPGVSTVFSAKSSTRRLILFSVFLILLLFTVKDLVQIVTDYFKYPITVSVLVSESRVLPFPGVTVCNLNAVHRGRFCSSEELDKPRNVEKILCATLTDLFEVCKITESLADLVEEGNYICTGSRSGKETKGGAGGRGRNGQRKKSQTTPGSDGKGSPIGGTSSKRGGVRTRKRNPTPRGGTVTKYPNSTEGPQDIEAPEVPKVPKVSVPRFVKRIVGRKIKKFARDNNLTDILPKEGTINAILKGQWNGQGIVPGSTIEADGGTGTVGTGTVGHRRGKRQVSEGEGIFDDSTSCLFRKKRKKRKKREAGEIKFNLRSLLSTFRSLQSGNLSGGLLQPLTESGGLVDTIVLQVASLYGINVNSTKDLLPAIFLRAFTQVTGCSVGTASKEARGKPNPMNEALDNLTTIVQTSGCIWKAPKLIKLFQSTSQTLLDQLSSCTGPWVNELLGFNQSKGRDAGGASDGIDVTKKEPGQEETPWYILLDLLETWLAHLARNDPEKAKVIGHQATDMIKSCYFAGKKCDPEKDFKAVFHAQHGNCFTYSMDSGEAAKESMSGFTGPKFGLELLFNLEKDQYMPVSREAGVKIIVHDRNLKADPDQDAINIQPGVVTYVGVQMLNISRLPAPYIDKCTDIWPEGELKRWAIALHHETYTIQVCLKICLQIYTIKQCACYAPSAPWPPFVDEPMCSNRRSKKDGSNDEECMDIVRHHYYEDEIKCDCPPRCTDRIYDRFLSTGQETRQCSAIQSDDGVEGSSADDKDNSAKVIVYFHSLSFNEIHQERKYTVEGLLGAIGGILGVYLGVSFFAIFEAFDVIFRGFTRSSSARRREHRGSTMVQPRSSNNNRRRRSRPFPGRGHYD